MPVAPLASPKHQRLLQVSGLLTWIAVGLDHLREMFADPSLWSDPQRRLCTLAFALFGAAYLPTFLSLRSLPIRRALLAVQTAAVLWLTRYPFGAFTALFCVTSAEAGFDLPDQARLWVAGQMVGGTVMFLLRPGLALGPALAISAMFAAFEGFALFAAEAVQSEARAREVLASVNTKLLLAQQALVEQQRAEERLDIARELHDSVGHHLTGLALKLEGLTHAVPENLRPQAKAARALVSELLAEVRAVVSATRNDPVDELPRRLTGLVANVVTPRVHLEIPEALEVEGAVARTVYRCVQEILTNAIRHSGAKNLWIEIGEADGVLAVRARDDGRGAGELKAHSGLRGMRERIEKAGGTLELTTAPGEGLALVASLPRGRGARQT